MAGPHHGAWRVRADDGRRLDVVFYGATAINIRAQRCAPMPDWSPGNHSPAQPTSAAPPCLNASPSCCASIRATRRRKTSPVTSVRTPPVGFASVCNHATQSQRICRAALDLRLRQLVRGMPQKLSGSFLIHHFKTLRCSARPGDGDYAQRSAGVIRVSVAVLRRVANSMRAVPARAEHARRLPGRRPRTAHSDRFQPPDRISRASMLEALRAHAPLTGRLYVFLDDVYITSPPECALSRT